MNSSLRILAVDDDPHICELIRLVLTRAGHTVETSCDGMEGLGKVLAKIDAYDLIITDMVLPTLSGTALITQVRAARFQGKVMVWTGALNLGLRVTLETFPIDGILEKPATAETLLKAVEEIAGG